MGHLLTKEEYLKNKEKHEKMVKDTVRTPTIKRGFTLRYYMMINAKEKMVKDRCIYVKFVLYNATMQKIFEKRINNISGIGQIMKDRHIPKDLTWNREYNCFMSSDKNLNKELNDLMYLFKSSYEKTLIDRLAIIEQEGYFITYEIANTIWTKILKEQKNAERFESFIEKCNSIIDNMNPDAYHTRRSYRAIVKNFAKFLNEQEDMEDIDLPLISADLIENYLLYRKDMRVATSTMKKEFEALKVLYKKCLKAYQRKMGLVGVDSKTPFDLVDTDLMKSTKSEKQAKVAKRRDFLSIGVLTKLKDVKPANVSKTKYKIDLEYALNMYLLEVMMNGVRVSDLLNIRANDIDFNEKTVRIVPMKTAEYNEGFRVGFNDLGEYLLRYFLDKSKAVHNEFIIDRFVECNPNKEGAFLKVKIEVGATKYRRHLSTLTKYLVEEEGFDLPNKLSPHQARRTFANQFELSRLREVSEALGHNNLNTTTKYYYNKETVHRLND